MRTTTSEDELYDNLTSTRTTDNAMTGTHKGSERTSEVRTALLGAAERPGRSQFVTDLVRAMGLTAAFLGAVRVPFTGGHRPDRG